MDEYIERETAIAAIMSEPPDAHYPQWYADKIKAIPAADVAPVRHGRWIPVTERLPERTMPPHDVLVYHDLNCGMFIDRAWYSHEKNKWRSAVGMNLKVTHWMPLPEPPEDGTV